MKGRRSGQDCGEGSVSMFRVPELEVLLLNVQVFSVAVHLVSLKLGISFRDNIFHNLREGPSNPKP